jgi:3-hydroxyisobutyrate dehydrogenase
MPERINRYGAVTRIVLIGTGDVGVLFARSFQEKGAEVTIVPGRSVERARERANHFGLRLCDDFAATVRGADVVLSAVTGESSLVVALRVLDAIQTGAIFADLTSAAPDVVREAAAAFAERGMTYVDAAIMGTVNLLGSRTPIIAAGEAAGRFADIMIEWGFDVSYKINSRAGDASMLKLLRSVFAKGLDTLVVEAMLVARTFGLEEDLLEQLGDFDRSTMRQTIDMYLSTHLIHANRRLYEMLEVETLLVASGLPAFVTHAAVERYRRTVDMLARFPCDANGVPAASANLEWLLNAEKQFAFAALTHNAE